MSVFTPLERSTLEAFLAPYDLGRLRDFRGIAEAPRTATSSSAWNTASSS